MSADRAAAAIGRRRSAWSLLGAVPPARLLDAALELRCAVQVIASAGQTFVEPRADESHAAMWWDETRRSFVGAPFAGAYPFRVALRPMDLTLQLLDRTDQALGSLPLAGHPREDAYEWLSLGLATYMGGPPPLLAPPDHEDGGHPVAAGAPFSGAGSAEHRALAALYAGAAELLAELTVERTDASPVTCWPHDFEIATRLTLEPRDAGGSSGTIEVGMAPFGGENGGWHWYVRPRPEPVEDRLPPLDPPGRWDGGERGRAVLSGEEVLRARPAARHALVRDFLDRAVSASTTALVG